MGTKRLVRNPNYTNNGRRLLSFCLPFTLLRVYIILTVTFLRCTQASSKQHSPTPREFQTKANYWFCGVQSYRRRYV